MNTALPPARDLPPHRHDEIRTAVVRAAGLRPPRRWVAPLTTAAAALVAVGAVAYLVPWGGSTSPATLPPDTTTVTTAPDTAEGLPAGEAAEIVRRCTANADVTDRFALKQVVTDETGTTALIYGHEYAMVCTVGGPLPPIADLALIPPGDDPVSIDYSAGESGGDHGKVEHRGEPGGYVVAGRVAPEAARVTYTQGGDTVDAVLGPEGTYLARIVKPSGWLLPDGDGDVAPVVRAYDRDGALIGEAGPM